MSDREVGDPPAILVEHEVHDGVIPDKNGAHLHVLRSGHLEVATVAVGVDVAETCGATPRDCSSQT